MPEPSVKGTIFQGVTEELNDMLAVGLTTREALARWLKPEDLDWLDRDIAISSWYPADRYCRLLSAMTRARGGDHRRSVIEGGHASARRVGEMGIYAQLDERTAQTWDDKIGRLLVTLSGAFFSFGSWRWQGLAGAGFTIEITDAAPFSDDLVLRTQGFIEFLACRAAGAEVVLSHERSADRDTLIYRAVRTS